MAHRLFKNYSCLLFGNNAANTGFSLSLLFSSYFYMAYVKGKEKPQKPLLAGWSTFAKVSFLNFFLCVRTF